MTSQPARYGVKASKPGRACVRSRERSHAVGLIVGRNRDGESVVTVYINHGRESMKAKLLLWELQDALNTAIRTAND
jgi:hypothetical protein